MFHEFRFLPVSFLSKMRNCQTIHLNNKTTSFEINNNILIIIIIINIILCVIYNLARDLTKFYHDK